MPIQYNTILSQLSIGLEHANIVAQIYIHLYSEPRPLSAEKASDLRKLLKYVPPLQHAFFNDILGSTATRPALEQVDMDSNNNNFYLFANRLTNTDLTTGRWNTESGQRYCSIIDKNCNHFI